MKENDMPMQEDKKEALAQKKELKNELTQV
jgi:hypothetical protein